MEAMKQVRATATAADPALDQVEIILGEFQGDLPLRLRASYPFFRRIWVTDPDGAEIEVLKDNLGGGNSDADD